MTRYYVIPVPCIASLCNIGCRASGLCSTCSTRNIELYLELKELGAGEEAKEALERALIEAWDYINSTIIEACLESIYRRRDEVIIAKG